MSTSNTPAHTPTPWSYFRSDGTIAAGTPAHTIARANYGDNWQANAAHIVLCVNSHDKLCEALKTFVQLSNNLAVALTAEQISEATAALSNHCHDARAALKESEAK